MKKINAHDQIKRLAFAAMLTAMSVVIGIFCKTALNFADGLFRITFEGMPIILAGIIFGPLVGGSVGIASDLISYLLSGQTYPPNLVVTLGAAIIGIVSGIVARFIIKKRGKLQFIVAGASAHILGSIIVKSVGLFAFYDWLVLWRIPTYIVIAPIEILLLILLYKNRGIKKMIDKISPLMCGNSESEHTVNSVSTEDDETAEGDSETLEADGEAVGADGDNDGRTSLDTEV